MTEPRRGTGRFQWNAGGWFGSQVGSTCWLFFVGILHLGKSYLFAGLLLACFVLANAIGTIIWMNRDRVDPYRAIQILLLDVLAFTTLAMVGSDCLGFLGELDPRVANPRRLYLVLLLFPTLMVYFHFMNGPESRNAETDS